ncbi:MAG: peptide chain release factor 2 [Candidatus Magasanikbacteria bacterium RIFCSPHIGHO2_01_FULL_41_23]|uniref:Peptide chain release factor 2 n=1 Tax=Candidatus Magasanikbacteria bacterium RIFCSPLOWO2_01_FULL_40_15 TaxID=1798686 RepID=A0A1F6N4N3_9BACT|nr:MAG: peptide chain release factor 2 [Candidatus Magasanikbacteria bacterium RIFCSPHIGHO2_01_FULL_41_23]OGH67171.1 MAG: peptide chain release factor 2 [Candidatus Magasanikbacteria bacterium RIFCSPHIGHO2_02_FULL_41_35]OGH75464.1 MAG: peptide chain release factor 2 [Candidatus Magasanikbacteria bacterium RIFCSPHIGHO2_12_FULL_41_16]OGH78708.1 MAG: peptide chain release factor 2 [Candidatus Magasanikbacteria bacterium RIFCSPLOWO2_01_FULL_40_15]
MIEQLLSLQTKIASTIQLLDIPKHRQEMKELEGIMQASNFWADQEKARNVSQTFEALKNEVTGWDKLASNVSGLLALAEDVAKNPDQDMIAEIAKQFSELTVEFNRREFFILFSGHHDAGNAIVSFHAGSGGTEAQDWTEMLVRMILRFCESHNFAATLLDESRGNEAGIKSATFKIGGRYAYGYLQSEHGTHRLVRISPFDAEKMRHTSFALIEVVPEIAAENIRIDPKELRIDTFMAGGKGGQSVNTTYSAVRIVHIPTGISVQCQNERSQLQNKDSALKILAGKLQKMQEEKEIAERLSLRGELKSPEWGSQIRSYVLHPYHMVKDVRTKYETADTDAVLNGELDQFVESYLRWKVGQ